MEENKTELGTAKPGAVASVNGDVLVPDIKKAAEAMKAFDTLKRELLDDKKDYVTIGGKLAITRAGFSKIALAFGLSTSVVSLKRIVTDRDYIVHAVGRAQASNGRFAEANASCSKSEFEGGGIKGTIANIEAKAGTRAVSRAVANLVGGGVLSEDELDSSPSANVAQQAQATKPTTPINPEDPISTKQKEYIEGLAGRAFGKEQRDVSITNVLATLANGHTLSQLNRGEANKVIEYLKTLPPHS